MTADLGVSTYDAIAITLESRWRLGKFKYMRIITDIICVISGCILYVLGEGKVSELPQIAGIGTIITAFFMGPLIDFLILIFQENYYLKIRNTLVIMCFAYFAK